MLLEETQTDGRSSEVESGHEIAMNTKTINSTLLIRCNQKILHEGSNIYRPLFATHSNNTSICQWDMWSGK